MILHCANQAAVQSNHQSQWEDLVHNIEEGAMSVEKAESKNALSILESELYIFKFVE